MMASGSLQRNFYNGYEPMNKRNNYAYMH